MVARFRAETALLKGRCALVESKRLHSVVLVSLHCQFLSGNLCNLLWLFWDFGTVAIDA